MHRLWYRAIKEIRDLLGVPKRLEINSMLLGQLHADRIRRIQSPVASLNEVEFRVFSQWGEDGIIQYLINRLPIENRIFIEFGVGRYTESNTRFLLKNNDWKGLVLDGSQANIQFIRHDMEVYWRHDLTAIQSFVTRENINETFERAGFVGDIGLLSIDIDGNDYWVWDAISVVNPRIVACEFNSVFGPDFAVTVPYGPSFQRTAAHHSNLYFGASLGALCAVAARKGYDFVGSCSAGVNAFFVRKDLHHDLKTFSAREGYIQSSQRESRDAQGNLTFIGGLGRLNLISHLEVLDVTTEKIVSLGDLRGQMRNPTSSGG